MKLLVVIFTALVSSVATYNFVRFFGDVPSISTGRAEVAPPLGIHKLPSPLALNIRGENWEVWDTQDIAKSYQKTLDENGAVGMTFCDKKIIVYDGRIEVQNLRNILWHEVFHAGVCTKNPLYWNSIGDGPGEHEGIQNIADYLEDFTRTNPSFMYWELE